MPPREQGRGQELGTVDTKGFLRRNKDEHMYLELFAKGEYRPELLFGEGDVARAAAASPEALWKLANLRKMGR